MRAFVLALVLSMSFVLMTIAAIRRSKLREQASLLWLTVSMVMVVLSATLPAHLIDHVAKLVGIAYAPDLLLLLAVLFLFVLVFQLSLSVVRLRESQTVLVQELGLLLSKGGDPGAASGPAMRHESGQSPSSTP